ncbi:hypothetical protein PTKIN_Ptkin19aG0093500 [Pterospermum kingtungense]
MTSNTSESLNGRLLWARRLPICSLLECGRQIVQQWFCQRRNKAAQTDNVLIEKATEKLVPTRNKGKRMVVQGINSYTFNVKDGLKSYVVNLMHRTCSCRKFDLDLMPCSHACAAIRYYYIQLLSCS